MFSPPVNLSVGQHAENRLVLSYLTAEAELECFDLSPLTHRHSLPLPRHPPSIHWWKSPSFPEWTL